MASNAQGLSVSWAGDDLGELVSVSVDGISSESVDVTPRTSLSRTKRHRTADVDYGTVSLVMRVSNSLAAYIGTLGADPGYNGSLLIGTGTGPSFVTLWSFDSASLQSLAWRATVGELQEYSAVFKLGASP